MRANVVMLWRYSIGPLALAQTSKTLDLILLRGKGPDEARHSLGFLLKAFHQSPLAGTF
jgi:hypothetical protein